MVWKIHLNPNASYGEEGFNCLPLQPSNYAGQMAGSPN